jgi:hypothetical protein
VSDASITPELRAEMRERVIRYEQELRSEQSYCQPSQIIDRENVPIKLGQYTDEQIDRIIALEREIAAECTSQPLKPDELLGRALNRYNLS